MTAVLGEVYRDRVTGFVGTATARAEYLGSTPSVRLTARTGQEDEKERWISESLIEEHRVGVTTGFKVEGEKP